MRAMLTVYREGHRLHRPLRELSDGALVPAVEVPERAERIVAAVAEAGIGEIVAPDAFGVDALIRVHDRRLLDFLASAWGEWRREGRQGQALPTSWCVRDMRPIEPRSIDGRLSYFAFDAGTPIGEGTWEAARGSADVALTAARAVAAGAASAFALSRPPGHHAGRDTYGGYCFLNNAAIAAEALLVAGADKIAILDVDYHHGNGTQSIFYDRGDVFFASLHADPRDEYPYFLGHADEHGAGAGEGCTANYPLPPGTGFDVWRAALDDACKRAANHGADAVVVSLGVDTFVGDPLGRFRLRSADYSLVGARIARLGRPTLFVMEGGYAVAALGRNVVNVLAGFLDAA